MKPDESKNPEQQSPDSTREQQYEELLALSRVSAALSGLWDCDAVLKIGLDNVLNIMGGNIGGILLVDEKTKTLSYRVHQGLSEKYVKEMHISLGEGIAGRVAQTGEAILLEDISRDPRVTHPDLVSAEGLKAFISVPLRAKDKVLGVINIASHNSHHFTEHDMYLLHSIGDQLGVAVEQAELYTRLRKARERLRRLARQNLVAEEEERRRISRELHDETSQTLSGIALQLQALISTAEKSSSKDTTFIEGLKKVQSVIVQVHIEISRIIADLRPTLLDTLGLIPAIRQHAKALLSPLDINLSVETRGKERRLSSDIEATLFRFTQGAVGNIAQHSQARNVTIALEFGENEIYLVISDDGRGFNVAEITDVEKSGRGRGLFSMRERIGLLDGTSSIESQIGKGTTVWARVPVNYTPSEPGGI